MAIKHGAPPMGCGGAGRSRRTQKSQSGGEICSGCRGIGNESCRRLVRGRTDGRPELCKGGSGTGKESRFQQHRHETGRFTKEKRHRLGNVQAAWHRCLPRAQCLGRRKEKQGGKGHAGAGDQGGDDNGKTEWGPGHGQREGACNLLHLSAPPSPIATNSKMHRDEQISF